MTAETTTRSPTGAWRVVVAQVVNGAAAYGYLVVVGRTLGDRLFAPVSVMWAAQFLVGSGMFISFEQELARAVAGDQRPTRDLRTDLRVVSTVFLRYLAIVTVAAVIGGVWITNRFLDGVGLVYVGLVLGVLGFAWTHAIRGVLAGLGWFDLYALWFLLDAGVRVVATLALVAAGSKSPGPYGLAGGGASLVAIVVVAALAHRRAATVVPAPAAGTAEPARESSAFAQGFGRAIAALTVAALLMAVLVNGGPIAVRWFALPGEQSRTSVFLTGLVLTRTPLLLFQTVQSALIPMLAADATQGDYPALRKKLLAMTGIVVALSVVGTLVAGLVGRSVVIALFGESFGKLSGTDLAMQAAAAFLLVLGMVFALGLIAVRHQRLIPVAWAAGVATFLGALLVHAELFARVERALVLSGFVAAATMGALAVRAIARPR